MSLQELKHYTFRSKYANYNKEAKRRETWAECVNRSKQMMLEKYQDYNINDIIEQAYEAVRKKEILGSQRSLQFGGQPILNKNCRIFNCCASYVDRPRFFQEAMYLLLCGCGIGYSIQKHHVNKLPKLVSSLEEHISYTIDDSVEGWSDAIGILINSYFTSGLYSEFRSKIVKFDYSNIRPKGSKLSYTTGKAPGAEPLKNAIQRIRTILNIALENNQEKLTTLQVHDIICHASDAVLSGGVRRSAMLSLFSHDDEEMIKCKTGNWFSNNPQRARANNSVVLLRDSLTKEDFHKYFQNIKEYGEPGFCFTSNLESLYNPCFEVGLYGYWTYDEDKFQLWQQNNLGWTKIDCHPEDIGLQSGWEFCNLSTINGGKCDTKEKFFEACKNASIIGTLQAGFTSFPYIGNITEKIVQKESLLGVSITGIMENSEIILNPEIQQQGAKIVKQTNEIIAQKIGINPAARTTVIKPEGTSSCILGTSSGIHPHHAKRYFRRVQANRTESVYQFFKTINPKACEQSVWSANDTDEIATFCIEVQDGHKLKNQLSAIELLENVKLTQRNWIAFGKTLDRCVQSWLIHNVSNTISVREHEWNEVENFLYNNRKYLCGISLIPESGDKDYPQAPFCTVYSHKEIVNHYGECALFVSGLIERALELYEDDLWKASSVLFDKEPRGESKRKWYNQCKKFAKKYLNNDIRKLTYLMKDVYNWKLWLDLNATYTNVNYDNFIEDENEVNIEFKTESACAGGQCLI